MALISPTTSDVHVNQMLSNISIGYTNPTYIADSIFPMVFVNKQTDIIPEYNQDYWFRDDSTQIAEGGEAPEVGYKVTTTDTYYCQKYGARHFISKERRANEDSPFNSDRDAVNLVTEKLMMRRERQFVSEFWTTSVWTTDVTGGSTVTKWSDFGASDPIEDIRTYKRTVRRLIGRDPNTLVLGDLTRDRLVDHPDILDRIKYTQRGVVNVDLLATLFDVNRVLVGESIYTTTDEEASTQSYSSNWDDDALLIYVPDTPALFTPSAGYTFIWRTGMQGGGAQYIRKYEDTAKNGDYVEVRSYYDMKQTVANAGCFFSDIVD